MQPMRSIACAVSMLAATAWAQGTTLRAEPADAPTVASAQTVSPRQRLLEIDQELDGLAHRPTGGSVFLASFKKLTPWFLGAALPLGALGVLAGLGGNQNTPRFTDTATLKLFGIATAVLGGVLVLDLLVCAGSVIDHWVGEADSAKARAQRVTELEAERAALTTSRPSPP